MKTSQIVPDTIETAFADDPELIALIASSQDESVEVLFKTMQAPAIAASMFAILMSVTNIGQGIGLGAGGALASKAGFPITFVIFGALMLLVIPFFPVLFKKKTN